MTELSGFLYNDAGCGVSTSGTNVEFFPTGCNIGKTGGSPTCSVDADSCGAWTISALTTGQYDVRITKGCSVRFIRYDNEQNVCRLELKNLVLNDGTSPNYTINIAAGICPATDRTLTLPSLCGNRTFQFIDQVQTVSAIHTHSADQIYNDGTDAAFGTASDTLVRWSDSDASNHAFVIGVGQLNQVLHIAEKCDVAVDWNTCANAADAEVHIHSSTTPATDYIMIGRHTGTTATIDIVGGTQLCFDFGGTTAAKLGTGGVTLTLCGDLQLTPVSCAASGIKFVEPAGTDIITMEAPAMCSSYTFKLPPNNGTSGQQMQTDGCGVTTWASAGSLAALKNIHSALCNWAERALDDIVTTPVYDFTYKDGVGTGDHSTHYMGIIAEEMPDVMHHGGTIFSPVSAFGKTALAIKALEKRVKELEGGSPRGD